jgi:Periplasmic binding protein
VSRRRRVTRLALPASAALAAVLVAGCGTTVPLQSRQFVGGSTSALGSNNQGTTNDGLGDTTTGGSQSATSPPDDSGLGTLPTDIPTTGGSGGGGTNGSTSPSGVPTTGSTKSSNGKGGSKPGKVDTSYNAIPAKGPGWDAKNVYIGVTTVNDIATVATALGLKSANPGNQVKDGEAMVAELNREGGLFGRKIVLAPDNLSTASLLVNPDQDASQACTHFTQDRPVIAVWNTLTPLDTPTFRSCFAQAKIPLLSGSIAPTDTAALNELHGYAISVISPSFTDLAPTLVARLKAEHFFTGWNTVTGAPGKSPVKIGIITKNTPTGTRAAALLSGALARAGYAPTAQFNYTVGASGTTSNLSTAVLQFRSRGITHVFSTDNGYSMFLEQANSQRYYPRSAISSFDTPELLQYNAPKKELVGALGIGSDPSLDVDFAQDPGYITPAEKTCLVEQQKLQSYAGLRFAEAIGLEYCDAFRLIRAAALAAGGLSGPDLVRGLQLAGPTYVPAISFESGLHTNDFALPGAGRDLAFGGKCQCFAYTSKTNYRFGVG